MLKHWKLVFVLLTVIVLIIIFRPNSSAGDEVRGYTGSAFTVLNSEFELPDYKGKICEYYKNKEIQEDLNWISDHDCFRMRYELDEATTTEINVP